MKVCFRCNVEKELSAFYRHPYATDGHLGKCKECCNKKDSDERYNLAMPAHEMSELENIRGRMNFHKDNERHVGKLHARNVTKKIPCQPGKHKHHWSYNPEHASSIIFIDGRFHKKLHSFLKYDVGAKMYRVSDRVDGIEVGVLLDSMDKHMEFIELVQKHLTTT